MGNFANAAWVKALAWGASGLILGLDGWLTVVTIRDWVNNAGWWRPWLEIGLVLTIGALAALLVWMICEPWLPESLRRFERTAAELPRNIATDLPIPEYRTILVPLDHSALDRAAITHAAALARNYGAKLYLLHVEEDVTSQVYGAMASTAEVAAGQQYLDGITGNLQLRGVEVERVVRFSQNPKSEIVRYARELRPDLIVMGAHGHKGLKDIIFGTTINALRHSVHTPLLVVRDPDL